MWSPPLRQIGQGHVPVGFWRAPGLQNAVYRECFVDELALAAGKVSSFRQVSNGGFVVYVRAFDPVAEAQVKGELPKFAESLRDNRANHAFREWLGQQGTGELRGPRVRAAGRIILKRDAGTSQIFSLECSQPLRFVHV